MKSILARWKVRRARAAVLAALLGAVALGSNASAQQAGAPVDPVLQGAPPLGPVPGPAGPASVADLAERLIGAVVNISTAQRVASPRANRPTPPRAPEGSPFEDFFKELFPEGRGEDNALRPNQSLGSGFVIDPSGLIVTNNHVIADADEVTVNFSDNSQLPAEVVGKDLKTDIAVLRVKPTHSLKAVPLGDSDTSRIGDWVLAIGNPFGFGRSVSMGIVSAIGRDISSGPYDNFIQTDAAINKGNSGGPLFNMQGEVIGINTAIISPTGGSIGLGFAIPSNLAKGVVDQLVAFGETRRGWMGVQIASVTDDIAEALGLERARGALISDVARGGPAEVAGIKAGDVVLSFGGRPINEMRELPKVVADTAVDAKIDVVVLRDGKEQTLQVTVGRLEEGDKQAAATPAPGTGAEQPDAAAGSELLGMTLMELTDQLRSERGVAETVKGVLVGEVDPASQAADKGLAPGDVLVEVAQEAVSTPADVADKLDKARKGGRRNVLLMVANAAGEIRFAVLRLDS